MTSLCPHAMQSQHQNIKTSRKISCADLWLLELLLFLDDDFLLLQQNGAACVDGLDVGGGGLGRGGHRPGRRRRRGGGRATRLGGRRGARAGRRLLDHLHFFVQHSAELLHEA